MISKPTVEELGLDLGAQKWQRSGDREGAIEVAFVPAAPAAEGTDSVHGTEWVLMRVAGDPEGRILVYDRHEWECFLDGARRGEFDDGTWAGPFGDDGPGAGSPGAAPGDREPGSGS